MSFGVLRRSDPAFPDSLCVLYDPPRTLYLRGERLDLLVQPAVAVVGARSCSSYGLGVARTLGRTLAQAGVVVVSGLAYGIDAAAHRGALEGGGCTVAVLGCGIDRDYPRQNAGLAREIATHGLVVSEYEAGVEPAPWRFPARNRIIAALAAATVVVEARERSGALITVDFALELGREVFAVPGEITSTLSAGTNELLRQGATPLTCTRDVLAALGLDEPPPSLRPELSQTARRILDLLQAPSPADELTLAAGIGSADVAVALLELELAGLVGEADGIFRLTPAATEPSGRASGLRPTRAKQAQMT